MARVLFALVLLLAGCASQADPKPAVCDGKHRRPANPYGSVVPNAPVPAARSPIAPPGPQSRLDQKSFAPCGGRA